MALEEKGYEILDPFDGIVRYVEGDKVGVSLLSERNEYVMELDTSLFKSKNLGEGHYFKFHVERAPDGSERIMINELEGKILTDEDMRRINEEVKKICG